MKINNRIIIICAVVLIFAFVFSISTFASSGYVAGENVMANISGIDLPIELIMSHASSFDRSFLFNGSAYSLNANTAIYTTDGILIPTSLQPGFGFNEIYEITQDMRNYPHARELEEPSTEYNCHFYAWYSQDLNNALYWVNGINCFKEDKHCEKVDVESGEVVQVGDIATYWLGTEEENRICLHSAYVSEIESNGNIVCVSKWGRMGLYEHDWNYVHDGYLNYLKGDIPDVEYYRYVQGEHDYYVDSISQYGHIGLKCSYCLDTRYCIHDVQFVANNAYTHNVACSICDFDIDQVHSYGLPTATSNTAYHNITCPDCNYTYTEPHQWIQKGSSYLCTLCGMTSTIRPPIVVGKIENEELVAALPPINNEEELTE